MAALHGSNHRWVGRACDLLDSMNRDFVTPKESTSLARGVNPEIRCTRILFRPGGADFGSNDDSLKRPTNDGPIRGDGEFGGFYSRGLHPELTMTAPPGRQRTKFDLENRILI